jgi:glycosyltransferase involved in cell wall biosynthesis
MKILYLITVPPPVVPGADALLQEVVTLQTHFGGEILNLYPFHRPGVRLPRWLYGWLQLPHLLRSQNQYDLIHLFNADLYPYPLLRLLKRPLIYNIVTSTQGQRTHPKPSQFASTPMVVVPSRRDLIPLRQWGFEQSCQIAPAIDSHRFHYQPVPQEIPFTLLAGSAPWVPEQFRSKGFDALFTIAQQLPELRLVLLWRGSHRPVLQARLRASGLEKRVEVIDGFVEVDQVLARVHAAVVLAENAQLVKAYPHSLLEALAAGKPVLVSQCIPLADEVDQNHCGVVVPTIDVPVLLRATQQLRADYVTYQQNALRVGQQLFSLPAMIENYAALYERCKRLS